MRSALAFNAVDQFGHRKDAVDVAWVGVRQGHHAWVQREFGCEYTGFGYATVAVVDVDAVSAADRGSVRGLRSRPVWCSRRA